MKHTSLIVGAPIVAIATLMIGLRIGAGDEFHAALVYIAAPGNPSASGTSTYAWQLMTYREDHGVRETVAMGGLSAVARTVDGQTSTWSGASNADGIAEMHFELAKTPPKIGIEVRAAGEKEPLALGLIDVNDAPIPQHPSLAEVEKWSLQPSQKSGMPLQVYVEGERLAVGAPGSIWVHAAAPATALHVSPELGVQFAADDVKQTCRDWGGGGGWTELRATALGQAASTRIEAKDGAGKVVGTWSGALPTAPGGFEVLAARFVATPADANVTLIAPNPRTVVYVEIDDEVGREFAAALPLAVEPGDPMPKAHFVVPPWLPPGPHWLVTSGNPRGAEKMSGATLALPFMMGDGKPIVIPDAQRPEAQCLLGVMGTQRIAGGFPRALAIDGIATRGAKNRARHRQGLFIGLIALGAAALLEVLLLTAASREARRALLEAQQNESAEKITTKPLGGGVVVALLVAVLGFALLAVLLVTQA